MLLGVPPEKNLTQASSKKLSASKVQRSDKLPVGERIALYSLLVATISVIIPAVLAYWSYQCRSTGRFCEGSPAAPAANDTVRAGVVDRLSSSEGLQSFKGLTIRRAGFWPFGKRFDVVAIFKDSETAIDSVPADDVDDIFSVQNNSVAAFLRSSQPESEARITAYFPPLLLKRTFSFGSPFSSTGTDIKIANLSFDLDRKELFLDVVTKASALRINDNDNTIFYIGKNAGFTTTYGATVAVELTDDFHVKKAYDVANRFAFEKSQLEMADCKKKASDQARHPGSLYACLQEQGEDLAVRDRTLKIFEWDGSRLNEVATQASCSNCYWKVDEDHQTMFVITDHQHDFNHVNTWLSIIRKPFEIERTLFVEGECKEFFPYEPAYLDDYTVRIQLTTDCSAVTISNRAIAFRSPDQKGQKITEYYLLRLDANGLPVSLTKQ